MIATTTNALLDEALRLASLGYRVFPLRPGSKVPLPGTHGVHEATTDSSIIEAWWSSNPHANIGLAMGCGVAALDLDPGAIQAYGFDSIGELELGMAAYPRQSTPRGGWHWFVREPVNAQWRNSVGKVGSGLDVKTDGGYVVVAPSRVLDPAKKIDGAYEWLEPLPDNMRDIPLAPQWLIKAIEEAAISKPVSAPAAVEPVSASEQTMQRAAAYARSIPPAVQGQHGHASLLWAATAMVRGFQLSDSQAMRILCDEYNPRCNPPWEGDELDREFAHKISDARTGPFSKPVGWLLDPEHAYGDGMTDAEVEKFTGRSPSENGSSVRSELERCTSSDSQQSHASLSAAGSSNSQTVSQLKELSAGAEEKRHHLIKITRGCDIEIKPIEWLWPSRFAFGKLSLLVGHPETSKTTMSMDLAARLSTGRDWPDGVHNTLEPRGVIMASGEDEADDTLLPRFVAAGGDPVMISFVDGVPTLGADGKPLLDPWTVDRQEALEEAIARTPNCSLVIVDPITAHMPENTKDNSNTDIRKALRAVAGVAERTGVCVLALSHLRKNGEGEAILKTIGSMAYNAAARAVYGVAKDKNDGSGKTRLLIPIKNNLAPKGLSIPFETVGGVVAGFDGLQPPVIVWGQPVEIDADEALGANPSSSPGHPAQDDAEAFLLAELADGPVPVKELLDRAKNAGHKDGMLRKAKKNLGVVAQKRGMNGGWVWVDSAVEISRHVEGDPEDVQGAPV